METKYFVAFAYNNGGTTEFDNAIVTINSESSNVDYLQIIVLLEKEVNKIHEGSKMINFILIA